MKLQTTLTICKAKELKKFIKPSNITNIYSKLELLLGLKFSGHTDKLTEVSDLTDEIYKRGEIQTESQYRNALNKFLIQILTNLNVIELEIYLQI